MPRIPITKGASPIQAEAGGRLMSPPQIPMQVTKGMADVGSALFNIGRQEQELINRADEAAAQAKLENFISDYRMKIAQAAIEDKSQFDELRRGFDDEWKAAIQEASSGISRDSQKAFENYYTAKYPFASHRIEADIFAKRVPYYQNEFRVQHLAAVRRGDVTTAGKLVDDNRQWFDVGEIEQIALENQLYVEAKALGDPTYIINKGLTKERERNLRYLIQGELSAEKQISQRQLEDMQEQNAIKYTLMINQDKITSPAVLNEALANKEITRSVYDSLYKRLMQGPSEENDPESLMKSYEAIQRVKTGTQMPRDAFEEILGYSTKLKKTTFDSLIPKLFPSDEEADPLKKKEVQTYLKTLEEMRKDNDINQLTYNEIYKEISDWVITNPDYTLKELDDKVMPLFKSTAKEGLLKRLWEKLTGEKTLRAVRFAGTYPSVITTSGKKSPSLKSATEMTDEEIRAELATYE